MCAVLLEVVSEQNNVLRKIDVELLVMGLDDHCVALLLHRCNLSLHDGILQIGLPLERVSLNDVVFPLFN